MKLIEDWDFDILISHNRYTLSNRNADALFDLAKARGVVIMNAAPYAGGVLAKGTIEHPRYVYQEANDETLAPIRKIEQACARHRVAPGAAALQFSLRDPRVASTICGVTRPERVEQTIEWATIDIPEALWAELSGLEPSFDDPEATRVYKAG